MLNAKPAEIAKGRAERLNAELKREGREGAKRERAKELCAYRLPPIACRREKRERRTPNALSFTLTAYRLSLIASRFSLNQAFLRELRGLRVENARASPQKDAETQKQSDPPPIRFYHETHERHEKELFAILALHRVTCHVLLVASPLPFLSCRSCISWSISSGL
jgi:hypothetical protein